MGNSISETSTVARVSQDTADVNPEVAACMDRNGITVLSNGGLQVSKATVAAKCKAAEKDAASG
jgi:hypothetical protein